MPGMTNQRGVSAIAVILVVLLLLALCGAAFFVYKQKQQKNVPQFTTFDHVDLNEEVVVFLFQRVPRLYNRALQLNRELSLIADELERIAELEGQYPAEKQIISSERSLWTRLQKSLNLSVKSLKNASESYYVAYMVNSRKGKELIADEIDGLLSDIDEVLSESAEETRRLKTVTKQTALDRLKNLF
jgi:hypothetical protein